MSLLIKAFCEMKKASASDLRMQKITHTHTHTEQTILYMNQNKGGGKGKRGRGGHNKTPHVAYHSAVGLLTACALLVTMHE